MCIKQRKIDQAARTQSAENSKWKLPTLFMFWNSEGNRRFVLLVWRCFDADSNVQVVGPPVTETRTFSLHDATLKNRKNIFLKRKGNGIVNLQFRDVLSFFLTRRHDRYSNYRPDEPPFRSWLQRRRMDFDLLALMYAGRKRLVSNANFNNKSTNGQRKTREERRKRGFSTFSPLARPNQRKDVGNRKEFTVKYKIHKQPRIITNVSSSYS